MCTDIGIPRHIPSASTLRGCSERPASLPWREPSWLHAEIQAMALISSGIGNVSILGKPHPPCVTLLALSRARQLSQTP